MFRLIKNEMTKLSKRKSIWAMLIVTVIIAFGTAVLYNHNNKTDLGGDGEYQITQWQKEVKDLERFYAMDHYKDGKYADTSVRAMQYRNRSKMLEYLLDNGYSPYDWRYTSGIIEKMFNCKLYMEQNFSYEENKAEHDRLEALIEADNWKDYYKEIAEEQLARYLRVYPMASDAVEEAVWFEYNYRTENGYKPGAELWRDNLISAVASAKLSLAYLEQQEYAINTPGYVSPSLGDSTMEKPKLTSIEEVEVNRAATLDKLAAATYRLQNSVKADVGEVFGEESVVATGKRSLFWESFAASHTYIIGVGALVIIIAGLIVASEFSSGTIKFLLVSPVKRWKIVTSKYIVVLLLSLTLTLLMYVSSIAASLSVFGSFGFDDVIVRVENGKAWGVSPFLNVLSGYGWAFIEVVVVATMAFALSALMRSTAVSIGVGLLAYLSGTALVELFSSMGIDFGRYILFANLDLPAIMSRMSIFPNQTLEEAIINIVAHMAVFLLTAWDGFVRREI